MEIVRERDRSGMTRRRFLRLGLALPVPFLLPGCRPAPDSPAAPTVPATTATTSEPPPGAAAEEPPPVLDPTPACQDDDHPTPPQGEGPFFTPESPERTSLVEPGLEGIPLLVEGEVLDTRCRPVAGALLDFWQADGAGAYDNRGYRFRGHQFADPEGGYRLETVIPGGYASRTPHIHVKVQAPDHPVLTTQLYFPGEPRNRTDPIFLPELVMEVEEGPERWEAAFNFVLDLG